MTNSSKINRYDLIGMVSASICLVHCIATPLLITFGAGFITTPIFKYLFLIISFGSVYKATEHLTNNRIALLLWGSFWGFVFTNLFEDEYHWLEYTGYIFAISIIIGHILNIKYCKQCSIKNEDEN